MLAEPIDEGIYGRRIDVRQLRAVDGAGIVKLPNVPLSQNGTGSCCRAARTAGRAASGAVTYTPPRVGDPSESGRLVIDDRASETSGSAAVAPAVQIPRAFR
ncbi:MAG: hypothetical protein ACLTG4_10620 [Oscillospiraceae bacterium]